MAWLYACLLNVCQVCGIGMSCHFLSCVGEHSGQFLLLLYATTYQLLIHSASALILFAPPLLPLTRATL